MMHTTFADRLAELRAVRDPERFFRDRANRAPAFPMTFPGLGRVLFVATPDGVRDILAAPATSFVAPTPNPIEPVVGTGSLILLSGDRHRRDRKLLLPPFHGERMRAYAEVMATAAREETAAWGPGAAVAIRAAAQSITLRIIIRAVFGVTDRERGDALAAVIVDLLRSFIAPLSFVPLLRFSIAGRGPWARFVRLRGRLDAMLLEQIAARRATGTAGYDDILSLLLDATYEDGSGLSDADLLDELRTLLVAGHETTATSLAWALFHVHRDAVVLARLRDELAGVEAPERLAKLPYLGAICQETLRMNPPVPIVLRRLDAPLTVAGQQCARGDVVGIAVSALHFDPDVWPDPHRFDPQRFLDRRPSPFEYTPFGGGHRRCVGAAFANYELAVVLGSIVAATTLHLPEKWDSPPRSVPRGIAVVPDREIILQA